ncbi:hypothetical protein CLV83_3710 [Marinobacterium mangrovicola]|uniref:Uncharacterized protein n=1 Tax=Marinobacterium mangrovicola TaxID=1476959 RepID=A0A4R1GJ06_9GAMM|nr:hypothetical protein CLV83_3710 [Marinobacterium mangrovicola]
MAKKLNAVIIGPGCSSGVSRYRSADENETFSVDRALLVMSSQIN